MSRTSNNLSGEECAEIISSTFTRRADVAIGRGSIINNRICYWWSNQLIVIRISFDKPRRKFNLSRPRLITGEAYDSLIALRVA